MGALSKGGYYKCANCFIERVTFAEVQAFC
jgi:hypothetical protein